MERYLAALPCRALGLGRLSSVALVARLFGRFGWSIGLALWSHGQLVDQSDCQLDLGYLRMLEKGR